PGGDIPGSDKVRCYMDCVAVVVAETEVLAAKGAKIIEGEYEDLAAIFAPAAALLDGAPRLHDNTPNNALSHYRIRKGDMAAGWAQAEVVVEDVYETTWQEHAYLQPEDG